VPILRATFLRWDVGALFAREFGRLPSVSATSQEGIHNSCVSAWLTDEVFATEFVWPAEMLRDGRSLMAWKDDWLDVFGYEMGVHCNIDDNDNIVHCVSDTTAMSTGATAQLPLILQHTMKVVSAKRATVELDVKQLAWVKREFVRRYVTAEKVLQTGGKPSEVKLTGPELKEIVKLYWDANSGRASAAAKVGSRQPTNAAGWKSELHRLIARYGSPMALKGHSPRWSLSCLVRVRPKIEQWPTALRERPGRKIVTVDTAAAVEVEISASTAEGWTELVRTEQSEIGGFQRIVDEATAAGAETVAGAGGRRRRSTAGQRQAEQYDPDDVASRPQLARRNKRTKIC
jgi:hypothetical protein